MRDFLEPSTIACYEYGKRATADDFARALGVCNQVSRAAATYYGSRIRAFAVHRNLQCGGFPAMSVSSGTCASTGLPIGIQFGGAFGREDLLFRLAAQFERASRWPQRKPAVRAGR